MASPYKTTDLTIANQSAANVRTEVQENLRAIACDFYGDDPPDTTWPYMKWADLTAGLMKIRNGANSAWITLGFLDQAYSHANLAALAGLTLAADKIPYATGTGALSLADLSLPARTLLGTNLAFSSQCQLSRASASAVQLSPFGGKYVFVKTATGWEIRALSAAISCNVTGGVVGGANMAANTTYYDYLYDNAGTLELWASTTAPAIDADTGVRIMTGNARYALQGQHRTDASGAIVDTEAQRFVRSWFNDIGITFGNFLAANHIATTSPYYELDTTKRAEFLAWANERCAMHAITTAQESASSNRIFYLQNYLYTGGVGALVGRQGYCTCNASAQNVAVHADAVLTEGYCYLAGHGGVSGSGTTPYYFAAVTGWQGHTIRR